MAISFFPIRFPAHILLLGSGELGKELTISLQRFGCRVTAVDNYANAPAMQVANNWRVLDMTDAAALTALIDELAPDLIVPEVEKLAADALIEATARGYSVTPSAHTVALTFDRQGIRTLASERAGVPTSPYAFASSYEELLAGAQKIGFPCYVKPTMSSSGHGQSRVESSEALKAAWEEASHGARSDTGRVIIEGEIAFDYEITLLTVRHLDTTDPQRPRVVTSFCEPIGHRQSHGDYVESWQPHPMPAATLARAQEIAAAVTQALADETVEHARTDDSTDASSLTLGLFGVELFIKGDEVYFSELSPRPHDTGMVTMISQQFSEFDLHARAILGLPLHTDMCVPAAASAPFKSPIEIEMEAEAGQTDTAQAQPYFSAVASVLATDPTVELRIFGKPEAHIGRRMAVALASADTVDTARNLAHSAISKLRIEKGISAL